MLWQKKLRWPSPPRLTNSIPEMEHHLATMDPPIPGPPVKNIDASTATLGDFPASSNNDQNQTNMQATSPITEPLPHMAKEQPLTAKDDQKVYATSKITETSARRRVISVTAKRSRPRISTLLACASYLLFHLLGVDLGVRLIQGYTESRLHRAEAQLQIAGDGLILNHLLQYRLDALLGTTLDQRYRESYDHCLARALYEADKVFLGLDFTQTLDVRNQTMDWATNNCGRLLYTPQVLSPEVSIWTTAKNLRRFAENAFALFRYKAVLLRCKWLGLNARPAAKSIVMDAKLEIAEYLKVPTEMPFGFTLDCEGRSRCHLIYSGPANPSPDRKTSMDVMFEARKEVKKWSWSWDRVLHISNYVTHLLAFLQFFIGHIFILAVALSRPRARLRLSMSAKLTGVWSRMCNSFARLQGDEQLFIGCFINVLLYALLHTQVKYITSEFDRPLLPVGASFCVFHMVEILTFFDPTSDGLESVRSLYRSVTELYLIARGVELPDSPTKKQPFLVCNRTTTCSDAKPASKIAARFISPLTTIAEDIQQERKAIHAEKGKQPRDDIEPEYGYATETDSDYDSDVLHASYVDLTGGAAPTVSEDASDWSVVED